MLYFGICLTLVHDGNYKIMDYRSFRHGILPIFLKLCVLARVTRGCYNPILSPSHRVVEQLLLFPGFLPEFLETSSDQENLRFLEKVATGN